ncbi:MAG: succinylglutamate desuccinylase/aspartoacylase family protein [Planctomycetota bacterium]|jgi:succinylglutamate desuccinylase
MTQTPLPTEDRKQQHIIGRHDSGLPGPSLLVQGGIHGNEPAGVTALQGIVDKLNKDGIEIRGRLIAVAGNLPALDCEQRFLARDLNRRWTEEDIRALEARDPALDNTEDQQQRELLQVYRACEAEADQGLVFVDLHSSSADGPPFTCLGDTRPNRRLALSMPVPMVLGLEECIDGAVMDYFNRSGHASIGVEGGRHCDPTTVDRLQAAIWHILVAAGMLDRAAVDLAGKRSVLHAAGGHLPRVVAVRYRHVIDEDDDFVMEPGFTSLDPVQAGQLLATDQNGDLRADDSALILLPLYQGQGEDGYFICVPVRRFWLNLSSMMRWLRMDQLAYLLPGVQRQKDDPTTILVNPRIARWLVVEVFHLLGFRKRGMRDGKLLFARRWANRLTARLGRG